MKIIQHLSAMAIITIIMGLIYASVQQTYRSAANDPQVQLVYDIKEQLQNGKASYSLFSDSVDLEKSLAVFIETYDSGGRPLKSTGYLNGKLPRLPEGVMEYVRQNGEHWVTWQPKENVRMAMGVIRVNSSPVSYLAVGRSLKEVEVRVSRLVHMILICWIICMSIVLGNWLVYYYHVHQLKYRPL